MSESSSVRYLGASIAIVAGTVAALRLIGITLIESYYEKHLSRLKQEASSRGLLHAKYKKGEVQAVDVVIIGAGMSGLSCAALLARCGHSVLVLEQHHDVCGGGTHMFELKGYSFDSGLHYTVPWSVPLFALTCFKKPRDVTPFHLMGEEEGGGGTVDKIYLVPPNHYTSSSSSSSTSFSSFKERDDAQPVVPFNMKYLETHLPELYAMFPEEKQAIDRFLYLSNCAMHYVKVMVFARLLPSWMQSILWALTPRDITFTASLTSKDLLDSLTSNLRLKALLSSMWIDTGARPDQASFMMGACVFRGISMEGGCYPVGGSTAMAKELVAVIHAYGGKVRIRAAVDSIVLDETCSKKPKVVGVRMADGSLIRSSRVVASNSVRTTFGKLLPPSICASHSTVLDFDVPQSDGFVMCNIGIAASAEEIGATNTNTWHIPVDERGDAFHPLERFFANPLDDHVETPTFITFPSLKDPEWIKKHPNKTSCQMLVMAKYEWFENFKGGSKGRATQTEDARLPGYEEIKKKWESRCLDIFLRYFPKARGRLEVIDVSTPLTIEDYLLSPKGGAVGLAVTPERFVNPLLRRVLDPVSSIKGLYLTGQDTMLCGVTLCQLSGVITAFRMEGIFTTLSIILKSIFLGDRVTK